MLQAHTRNAKPRPRVGIALSGGADSAFAAFLLKNQDIDLHAYTFRVWEDPRHPDWTRAFAAEAAAVAERLHIPHVTIDLGGDFRDAVVEPFLADYARGRTPSPCVRCNTRIKFGLLLDRMLADGCEAAATGHYARTDATPDGHIRLLRGIDLHKDQSYFLAGLSRDQLKHAVFPLGDRLKRDVSAEARRLGLVDGQKPESQDLCFVPDGDYARLVENACPGLVRPGTITDESGRVLGTHNGTFRYTIGQRRGLGLSGGPWYVVAIDASANTVIVGPRHALGGRRLRVRDMNWLIDKPPANARVKLRYNMEAQPATIQPDRAGRSAVIAFERTVHAITPGQFAVLYDGDIVLGGGWIDDEEPEDKQKGGK